MVIKGQGSSSDDLGVGHPCSLSSKFERYLSSN
nr:MAG TPA: hypothetical protein [Inoviridae sp.]